MYYGIDSINRIEGIVMMFGADIKLTFVPSLYLLNFSLTLVQSSSQLLLLISLYTDHVFEPAIGGHVGFGDLILRVLPIYILLARSLF